MRSLPAEIINMPESDILINSVFLPGLYSKGYGILYKAVMLDPTLSIEAKGVYAYLASFTGGGKDAVWPSRSTILEDLHIAKNSFYKYLNNLIDEGYVRVEHNTAGINIDPRSNVYMLAPMPAKYLSVPGGLSEAEAGRLSKIAEARDLKAGGFGLIPKMVVTDPTLSLAEKGFYAYLCVLADLQTMTVTTRTDNVLSALKIGKNTYHRHCISLENSDYLFREIQKDAGGIVKGITFILNKDPNCPENIKNSKQISADSPYTQICDTPSTQICDVSHTQICDISSTRICDISHTQICDTSPAQICDTSPTQICDTKQYLKEQDPYNINPSNNGKSPDGKTDINIFDEIYKNGTLPLAYLNDRALLERSIRLLSNWNKRSRPEYYTEQEFPDGECELYKYIVEDIIEMLDPSLPPAKIGGAFVTCINFYEKLGSIITTGQFDDGGYYISITEFIDYVRHCMMNAARQTKIGNPKKYLKSVIWTAVNESKLSELLAYRKLDSEAAD